MGTKRGGGGGSLRRHLALLLLRLLEPLEQVIEIHLDNCSRALLQAGRDRECAVSPVAHPAVLLWPLYDPQVAMAAYIQCQRKCRHC